MTLPFIANADDAIQKYLGKRWELSKTEKNYLEKGEVLADANVTTIKKEQEFKLKAVALHPKTCTKVLRKLSMLENYSQWISFINRSEYNEKNKLFTLRADHMLLPFPMIVHIIVDRPTQPGVYPFVFPTGIFTGLKGEFEIKKVDERCLFYAHSKWRGEKTKIPDLVIEVFSETLSKLGGEVLMRKVR
ncbi:MAG: hypothetical protein CME62_18295 [Halobacteriovoraceae bacterium]|nr:hypothetical protein [Halobacteriovoraceae bacterium]|tara:strand:+ start:7779 stop:8345 length:567 start_codon:yes stop_codon:yes gene_type:complete